MDVPYINDFRRSLHFGFFHDALEFELVDRVPAMNRTRMSGGHGR